jgi:hypothetical protein
MRIFFCLLLSILYNSLLAQIGGSATFRFLDLPASARTAALGGNLVSIRDNDLNTAFNNPAILNPDMNRQITFNYNPYFAGIKHGYTSFAKTFNKIGTFSAGLQFVSYGTFDRTDETAAYLGSFSGGDYALNFSMARPIGLDSMLFVGVTIKFIYSHIDTYTALGLAGDIGISYHSRDQLTSAALVIRNAGTQLKSYTSSNREPLPVEIEAGITQKLSKAPFRFTLTARHLEKWDLTYTDPSLADETDPLTGEPKKPDQISFGNKLLRHVIISNEILISRNFHLRMAYNFQRRNEMKVETRPAMVGISFGLGIKVSKFYLSYGRSIYHLAGGTNSLAISTYLGDYKHKAPQSINN